eukprot:5808586-Prymnesium_polylepis.1
MGAGSYSCSAVSSRMALLPVLARDSGRPRCAGKCLGKSVFCRAQKVERDWALGSALALGLGAGAGGNTPKATSVNPLPGTQGPGPGTPPRSVQLSENTSGRIVPPWPVHHKWGGRVIRWKWGMTPHVA